MPTLVRETEAAQTLAPTFSIVTGTYQRVRELGLLLESLVRELADAPPTVEVVLCDNASSDGSHEMVMAFMDQHPAFPIRYYQQGENVGLDHNVLDVLALARGSYAWFIADDDEIAPGRLQTVMGATADGEASIVIVRSSGIAGWLRIPEGQLDGVQDVRPADPRFTRQFFATSFLASLVFRMEDVRRHTPAIRALLAGTNYAPFGLGLRIMSHADRLKYIDETCVLGNVNFNGEVRFDAYEVLIKNRAEVIEKAASGPMREVLRGEVVELLVGGWRSEAAGSLDTGMPATARLKAFGRALRRYGMSVAPALPWVLASTVLPARARRALNDARLSIARRS